MNRLSRARAAIAILIALILCLPISALSLEAAPAAAANDIVPGEILVKFQPGTAGADIATAHRQHGGQVQSVIQGIDVQVVRVPAGQEQARVAAYARHRNVLFAEVNGFYHAVGATADPRVGEQWQYNNVNGADIDAYEAWDVTLGNSTVAIAILDTGIDQNHEDLAAKVVKKANFTTSRTTEDKYGHGTAVAGVAAAITDNGKGVAGVGYGASLMNVKVLTDRGISSCSSVANGIVWAADNGAHVANLSLGNPDCSAMASAVDYAWQKGVLVAGAAGNDGDSSVTYPAYYANAIAVGATDNSDARASFSNWGTWVDVVAPGVSVYTTFPNHRNVIGKKNYDYGNGTSMSTPFVAGAAALVWPLVTDANGNGRVNDEVRARLEAYADPIAGTGTLWSNGRLNACNAAAASLTACPLH